LREAIWAEARSTGAPYPDPYARTVGSLLAALQVSPSAELYLALADQYLARAETLGDANYRLLAAETLEAARQKGADDLAIRERLGSIYRALAETARAAGNAADALRYLEQEADLLGSGQVDATTREQVTLSWAVDLASRGQIRQALV